jgi:DHA1 family bicyclomycin/chloramphenicol resistance-like MFS transporter
MAIHMLVPALPTLANDIGVGEAAAQQLVSVYLMGLAGGQLLTGPLADRWGRRKIMLGGLIVYAASSIVGALASGLPTLLAARLFQAVGGAAGLVTARVMVGDLFGSREAAQQQATLMAIATTSPAVAPVIGGVLADSISWRAIPTLLALTGILLFLAARALLPETRVAGDAPSAVDLIVGYRKLSRHTGFILIAVAMATSAANLYLFLAAAPFLLGGQAGLSPTSTGTSLVMIALGVIVGTRMLRFVQRWGDALVFGTSYAVLGSVVLLALSVFRLHTPIALIAPVTLIAVGSGITSPAAVNEVRLVDSRLAATATSLAGAFQMFATSAAVALLGFLAPLDTMRVGVALLVSSSVGLASAFLRRSSRLTAKAHSGASHFR